MVGAKLRQTIAALIIPAGLLAGDFIVGYPRRKIGLYVENLGTKTRALLRVKIHNLGILHGPLDTPKTASPVGIGLPRRPTFRIGWRGVLLPA